MSNVPVKSAGSPWHQTYLTALCSSDSSPAKFAKRGSSAARRGGRVLCSLAVLAGLGCSSGGVQGTAQDMPPGSMDPGPIAAAGSPGDCVAGTAGCPVVDPLTPPPSMDIDIGVAAMGRLNRTQYNRTVQDLLGTEQAPADTFPADELAFGFDTAGASLRVQPLHVEKYLLTAQSLAQELLAKAATDPIRQEYIACADTTATDCQLDVLRRFASKAWRRPVTDVELAPYQELATALGAEQGLLGALQAILTSANFIFRIEKDPSPDDMTPHPVSAFELASRLSYFLRGSMPDAALWAAAESGALNSTETLQAEAARLLADAENAQVFVNTFGAQWLNVNTVRNQAEQGYFESAVFPDFNGDIARGMADETLAFFNEFVQSARPLAEIFTADFSYVNPVLATHYGLTPPASAAMEKVTLTGTTRSAGILTQGTFLATTSNPNRTSPVNRGRYVLDRFLCDPPAAPPEGVDTKIDGPAFEGKSMRERLKIHQEKGPSCAACHVAMDSIGLALENYDAIGRYRAEDESGAIDASGELAGAGGVMQAFNGAPDLAQILSQDPRLTPCMVEKLLTFSLGRSFASTAQTPRLSAISAVAQASGGSVSSIIGAVVASDAFRYRRAAPAE